MSNVPELALLFTGVLLGIVWFRVIVLPPVYGFPRGLYWAARGWVRWRVPFRYLLIPLIGTVAFLAVALTVTIFLPDVANYLPQSGGFGVGLTVGILLEITRAIFSKSKRVAMTRDFTGFMKCHLTVAGRKAFIERVLRNDDR